MTQNSEIEDLTKFTLELAAASAKIILPQFRKNISIDVKAAKEWDPVTEADRSAERVIREMIEKHKRNTSVCGYESGRRRS